MSICALDDFTVYSCLSNDYFASVNITCLRLCKKYILRAEKWDFLSAIFCTK